MSHDQSETTGPSSTDTELRPHRGMRSLRRGLPLDPGGAMLRAVSGVALTDNPSTPDQFRHALTSEVERAQADDSNVIVLRVHHRPLPRGADRIGSRPRLEPSMAERLAGVHADLQAVPLSHDELAIFVPGIARRADGETILSDVVAKLNQPIDVEGLPHHLSPAVGAALLDRENPTADLMMDGAALALAETDATNPGMLFHPYHRVRHERQLDMEQDLRTAVLENQTTIALQPSIDLNTGKINSIEVFARWDRPNKGKVSAVEFIRTAEQLGLLHQLGRQVLERALFCTSDWVEQGLLSDLTLWANMTPSEILHPDFPSMMMDALTINPRVTVGIELRPTPPSDERYVFSVIRALVARGARAAIGDFGIGCLDMASIHQLPFDSVKLDRTLMPQIASNERSAGVIDSLIKLARQLELEVTAQGIESFDQVEVLRSVGCQFGQGFHIARPMSVDEFDIFLRSL